MRRARTVVLAMIKSHRLERLYSLSTKIFPLAMYPAGRPGAYAPEYTELSLYAF
jgi:hypothetical protein